MGIDSPGPGIRCAVLGRQQGRALSEGTLPHFSSCLVLLAVPGIPWLAAASATFCLHPHGLLSGCHVHISLL